jgi:hypothetical protein
MEFHAGSIIRMQARATTWHWLAAAEKSIRGTESCLIPLEGGFRAVWIAARDWAETGLDLTPVEI